MKEELEMGNTLANEQDGGESVAAASLAQSLIVPEGGDLLAQPPQEEVRRRPKSIEQSSANSSVKSGDEEQQPQEQGAAAVDPHAAGLGGDLTSAILGIIKGMVGPAILYLPHGFATTGYALAIPIICIATIMYLYASKCLLDAWKKESALQHTALSSSTTDGGKQVVSTNRRMLTYPELAHRALGPWGETAVKCGIALMQSGVCLTYLIFVPHNLHTSVRYLFNVDWSPTVWLCLMVIIEIPLSWVTDIRKLTCTNFAANVLILYGLILCLGFAFAETARSAAEDGGGMMHRLHELRAFESQWYLFIGTSVLLFEGSITLLIPLQEAVLLDEDRKVFPKTYRRVILTIIIFYIFFGTICWAAFGDNVHVVLTTSLPSGLLATSVQLAYSLAVLMTYPLQNFPALEIATVAISSHVVDWGWSPIKRHYITTSLVILLALVAVTTMNSLDKVVSLMGSLLGCPIAFVVPPMIHTKLCDPMGMTRFTNYAVATAGVISMVAASFVTVAMW